MKRKIQSWNNRKQSTEVANEYPLSKGQKKRERNGLVIKSTRIGENQCERKDAEKVTNTTAIRQNA
jgi:hypothetical protein